MESIAGKYLGNLINWSVSKSRHGAVQFEAEGILKEKLVGGDKVPSEYAESVHAYCVLISREGKLNNRMIESLKKALDWDGNSLKDLHNGNYMGKLLKFVVQTNDEGEPKIEWISDPEEVSGFFRSSEKAVDDMDNLWNSCKVEKKDYSSENQNSSSSRY